ncbi:MAG: cobaltochelatase subunit CobN, partial [Alphaproteobacteria bacterium]|nr:cobaltochelatase subunit CobN [Alphaproteobacteria bacterium]
MKPAAERRVAIIAQDAVRDAAALLALLEALAAAGYRTGDIPSLAALTERLASLPGERQPRASAEEDLSFADYSVCFAALPPDLQNRVAARWGAAERDALYRPGRLDCGRFAVSALRCGNIAMVAEADATIAGLADLFAGGRPPPRHAQIALWAWLENEFR